MYVPNRKLLRGLSLEVCEQFGKPHINAWYVKHNDSVNSYRFNHDSICICGKRATNVHHCPPKSKGKFILHGHVLKPALFALCGSGTTGCHGKFHQKQIIPKWEWNSDEYAKSWWSGELLESIEPHSTELYEYGAWKFEDKVKNFLYFAFPIV